MISCLIGKPNDRKPVSLPRGKSETEDAHKLVWVKEDALIRPVVIEVGINDLYWDNFKI
jgi:hypothetical protein